MKYYIYPWLVIFAVLLVPAISVAGQIQPSGYTVDFRVGPTRGDRDTFSIEAGQAGCILARVQPWPPDTSIDRPINLALIVNSSDQKGYYARSDGNTRDLLPLWTSYAVSSSEAAQVGEWTISVVNFTEGSLTQGQIQIEFPPAQIPCELLATVPRTPGKIDLSWRYTNPVRSGYFLIERSVSGGAPWSLVSTCGQSVDSLTGERYTCSDSGLSSNTIYTYRACWVASSSVQQCDTSNVTPAVSAKAP